MHVPPPGLTNRHKDFERFCDCICGLEKDYSFSWRGVESKCHTDHRTAKKYASILSEAKQEILCPTEKRRIKIIPFGATTCLFVDPPPPDGGPEPDLSFAMNPIEYALALEDSFLSLILNMVPFIILNIKEDMRSEIED